MKKNIDFNKLHNEHFELMNKKGTHEGYQDAAQDLLNKIRNAGEYITNDSQRQRLEIYASYWRKYLYEMTDFFQDASIKAPLINPFGFHGPISPTYFIADTNMLRRITGEAKKQQLVSINGPLKIGKTSLLKYCSCSKFGKDYFDDETFYPAVYIDFKELSGRTAGDFFYKIAREISNVNKYPLVDLSDNPLQSYKWIKNELTRNMASDVTKNWIFFMDEFEKISELKLEKYHLDWLADLLRNHNLCMVTASKKTINDIITEDQKMSETFRTATEITLTRWDFDTAKKLVFEPQRSRLACFDDDDLIFIEQLTGFHPAFMQQICYLMFEYWLEHRNEKIDHAIIKDQYYKKTKTDYKLYWEEELGSAEKNWLEINLPLTSEERYAQKDQYIDVLERLEDIGFVSEKKGKIEIQEGLKMYYYNQKANEKLASMDLSDIKNAQ
jgi:hypothetical protein